LMESKHGLSQALGLQPSNAESALRDRSLHLPRRWVGDGSVGRGPSREVIWYGRADLETESSLTGSSSLVKLARLEFVLGSSLCTWARSCSARWQPCQFLLAITAPPPSPCSSAASSNRAQETGSRGEPNGLDDWYRIFSSTRRLELLRTMEILWSGKSQQPFPVNFLYWGRGNSADSGRGRFKFDLY
jgi:hypothetical protein